MQTHTHTHTSVQSAKQEGSFNVGSDQYTVGRLSTIHPETHTAALSNHSCMYVRVFPCELDPVLCEHRRPLCPHIHGVYSVL